METKKLLLPLIAVCIIFTACTTTEVHETDRYHKVEPNFKGVDGQNSQQQAVEPQPKPAPVEPQTGAEKPDWVNQKIEKVGSSAVDPEMASRNPGQAKLMAKRGAIIDAKRQLLEQVLGLKLDSKTEVRNMVTEKDEINAGTSGYIRGAKIIGQHFDGSIYEIKMEMKLYTVYEYMRSKRVYYK